MAHSGLFIALCAVLLAVDGSAQPAPADTAPIASPCLFTLEREAVPADDGETWVLTCHRTPKTVVLQPVVQRRPIRAPLKSEG